MRGRAAIALLGLLGLACVRWVQLPAPGWQVPVGPAPRTDPLPREPCAFHVPERTAWFGDLHVHTGFSMDARVRGLLLMPDDAYRFARGESLDFPPLRQDGRGRRPVALRRPLDFAAVTDHAELLAETALCVSPTSAAYDSGPCRRYRGDSWSALSLVTGDFAARLGALMISARGPELCGEDGSRCRLGSAEAWRRTQEAAERHYDRSSACSFTTFHAWEHTFQPGMSKVHRNVILRNEIAPELPISSLEEPGAAGLWRALRALCTEAGGACDAITIPHNPNLSQGKLFALDYLEAPEGVHAERAAMRAAIEPLVEMMQAKGESECRNGLFEVEGGPDELCDFEKIRGLGEAAPRDCERATGDGALGGSGCTSRLDYARYALIEGLREEQRIGVNPLRLGFIGSTDTHNASPGAVSERDYEGTRWTESATRAQRLASGGAGIRAERLRNPGGLVGIWAEENTREALFDAMRRRETFATSGPRMRPRFFGGWGLSEEACARPNVAAAAYREAVPMGSELPPRAGAAPTFLLSALSDEGLLERAQIIKGWVGSEGHFHQAVYDVAGARNPDAGVDPVTCEPQGEGHRTLCGVWSDPEFDPEIPSVYYARILENPSCRWTTWQCLELPETDRPPVCDSDEVPHTIQERAWTSAIWFVPEASPGG